MRLTWRICCPVACDNTIDGQWKFSTGTGSHIPVSLHHKFQPHKSHSAPIEGKTTVRRRRRQQNALTAVGQPEVATAGNCWHCNSCMWMWFYAFRCNWVNEGPVCYIYQHTAIDMDTSRSCGSVCAFVIVSCVRLSVAKCGWPWNPFPRIQHSSAAMPLCRCEQKRRLRWQSCGTPCACCMHAACARLRLGEPCYVNFYAPHWRRACIGSLAYDTSLSGINGGATAATAATVRATACVVFLLSLQPTQQSIGWSW